MNKTILIIEDDLSIAELQKDYLEVAGFEVMVSNNGSEGFMTFRENDIDLLILDIMLPGMDGLEILRSLKEDKDVPVLLVSAKKEEIDKIKGLSLGADDYITKPFSPGELVARVKAHLENYERLKLRFQERAIASNVLKIRGLKIDKDSHRVYVLGEEVNLAQKEYALLLYMAENPNRVFGREELFERVWGLDAIGDSATVTVHIARIREKIERDVSNPQYLETVWGAGYRFRV
ncbi:response regulator with CheY-like receiver domain and winged-helix DNA-binding domain [Desulfosporosinus orientis DSM 765]|uniref:Stage 0 sporulation protein A homolog n=1 Tax=Desulfosporosinus orientis (strain ATCC 19365 / DSM 765 / NCIMB 8382 / VKM B-1628 / Singapore I) TaxID=768706 RepID=G7W5X3_DESOD|nr:response regulator transcription factor [Desulfosporosinus orientis]AET67349.1 response regulator with CheY-like receiver domain and winged-helix DNA-binding domain [Desulfosporosinus orientis DSM 765]